jgi:hypothetical protein
MTKAHQQIIASANTDIKLVYLNFTRNNIEIYSLPLNRNYKYFQIEGAKYINLGLIHDNAQGGLQIVKTPFKKLNWVIRLHKFEIEHTIRVEAGHPFN